VIENNLFIIQAVERSFFNNPAKIKKRKHHKESTLTMSLHSGSRCQNHLYIIIVKNLEQWSF